jgi:hypothetical protein
MVLHRSFDGTKLYLNKQREAEIDNRRFAAIDRIREFELMLWC